MWQTTSLPERLGTIFKRTSPQNRLNRDLSVDGWESLERVECKGQLSGADQNKFWPIGLS